MNIAIGTDRIQSAADHVTLFVCQIGVTRIGSTGRALPRTRRGQMASVANLVLSTVDPTPAEFVTLSRKALVVAHNARKVVTLALVVVVQPVALATRWTLRALAQGTCLATNAARLALNTAAFSMPVLVTLFSAWVVSSSVGTAFIKTAMMTILR